MKGYQEKWERLGREGLQRSIPQIEVKGKMIVVKGRELLNLSGNDYLGLGSDQALRQAFDSAQWAMTSSSSRLLTGNNPISDDMEDLLSQLYDKESALLWDSGYHANTGLIPAIGDEKTLFVADKYIHASMIDGIRLSGCDMQRFRHNDLNHLRRILEKSAADYDRVWILIESIYSMDGDVAPLAEIIRLKKSYPHLYLYLDEAHGVGVRGERGLGYAEEVGVLPEIDILVGTMGKALASVGAYSVMPSLLRSLAVATARPLIFSTALPPICEAWSKHVICAMTKMSERRSYLRGLTHLFSQEAGVQTDSHIIPIVIPGIQACTEAAEELIERGFYVRPIRKPTVPEGQERIRLSLSAAMTREEVYKLAHLIRSIKERYL